MRIFIVMVSFVLCFQMELRAQFVNGGWASGPNPPMNWGQCYNLGQQQFVAVQAPINGLECDSFNFCQPVQPNCIRTAIASPMMGCTFRRSVNYVLVGTCAQLENHQCSACPNGSEIFCMTYQYFASQQAGSCSCPCGEYLVFFGGECRM